MYVIMPAKAGVGHSSDGMDDSGSIGRVVSLAMQISAARTRAGGGECRRSTPTPIYARSGAYSNTLTGCAPQSTSAYMYTCNNAGVHPALKLVVYTRIQQVECAPLPYVVYSYAYRGGFLVTFNLVFLSRRVVSGLINKGKNRTASSVNLPA